MKTKIVVITIFLIIIYLWFFPLVRTVEPKWVDNIVLEYSQKMLLIDDINELAWQFRLKVTFNKDISFALERDAWFIWYQIDESVVMVVNDIKGDGEELKIEFYGGELRAQESEVLQQKLKGLIAEYRRSNKAESLIEPLR
jgi:hypothetical protein